MKNLSYQFAQRRGLTLLGLLLLVLAILGGMIWRNLNRLETVRSYVSYSHRILKMSLDLQHLMAQHLSNHGLDRAVLTSLAGEMNKLITHKYNLALDTPAKLREAGKSLSTLAHEGREAPLEELRAMLVTASSLMNEVVDAETVQREELLENIGRDTRTELVLAIGTLLAIFLLAGWFLHRRILIPLHDLQQLLARLSMADFTPIETRHLDPFLLPVFNSYNEMVMHLSELEEGKRLHAQSLESEVRSATRALLEQQGSLARAERLAAVGELSASLAHELRNPLAGIQMACSNLRNEIDDPDHVHRLDLVGAELRRITRLLNSLLHEARHIPEPSRELNINSLVSDLVALTRYQIPTHIRLESNVPAALCCSLPGSGLRQALLNLMLNAVQALDKTPGSVRITARRDNDTVYIIVSDNGPGFPPEMLTGGIRPFISGRQRGTGLGLAMVQRFVREVGGEIKLSNREPHGGCVTLSLPYRYHQDACNPPDHRGRTAVGN